PEGGDAGGEVVACGTPDEIVRAPESRTGQALLAHRTALADPKRPRRRVPRRAAGVREEAPGYARASTRSPQAAPRRRPSIEIVHAREHNLRNIDVTISRDKLT